MELLEVEIGEETEVTKDELAITPLYVMRKSKKHVDAFFRYWKEDTGKKVTGCGACFIYKEFPKWAKMHNEIKSILGEPYQPRQ